MVHSVCFSGVYGNKERKTVLIPVIFVPIPVALFPIVHPRKRLFRFIFRLGGDGATFPEKNLPCFRHTNSRFLNVSARPNFLSKHWVVWAKKRNFAAYKDRPAPFRVRFAGQPERRCKNVYKRKSLTARPKT